MNDDRFNLGNQGPQTEETETSNGLRRKKKVKIRYRQRVKLKKRTRMNRIHSLFKINYKNVFAVLILIILIILSVFLVVELAAQLDEALGR